MTSPYSAAMMSGLAAKINSKMSARGLSLSDLEFESDAEREAVAELCAGNAESVTIQDLVGLADALGMSVIGILAAVEDEIALQISVERPRGRKRPKRGGKE